MFQRIVIFSIVFTISSSEFCTDNTFPDYEMPPNQDQSSGKEPRITTCRKYLNDRYHLCHCFGSDGTEIFTTNKTKKAHHYCCQCPKDIEQTGNYRLFTYITIGEKEDNGGTFQLNTETKEFSLKRCNDVTLRDIKNIHSLTIVDSKQIQMSVNKVNPSLEVSIRGKKRPTFGNNKAGTELLIADEVSIVLRNMKLENVKIRNFPRKMKLNSLTITSSHITEDPNSQFFDRNDIKNIVLDHLNIDSIYQLGLDKLQNSIQTISMTNSKIKSLNGEKHCWPENEKSCFFPEKENFHYKSNSVPCHCHNINCTKQAVTRFSCTEEILEQTICSTDVQIKSCPVKLKFLKENNVSKDCEKFNTAIITLDEETDNKGYFESKGVQIVVIALSALVALLGLIGLLATGNFLRNRKDKMSRRRHTIYKPTKKDHQEEGTPLE